jgi:hypothetical protein
MEPLPFVLILAILALFVWAVRSAVKRTWLDRGEPGVNDDLEHSGVSESEAEPTLGGEPAPSENPADDPTTRLQARRAAGVSEEDLDY